MVLCRKTPLAVPYTALSLLPVITWDDIMPTWGGEWGDGRRCCDVVLSYRWPTDSPSEGGSSASRLRLTAGWQQVTDKGRGGLLYAKGLTDLSVPLGHCWVGLWGARGREGRQCRGEEATVFCGVLVKDTKSGAREPGLKSSIITSRLHNHEVIVPSSVEQG